MPYEVELNTESGTETIIIQDCKDMDDAITRVRKDNPDSDIEFIGVC